MKSMRLYVLILAGLCLALPALAVPWCDMALAKWSEALTLEGSDNLKPPYGVWTEEPDGALQATGKVDRWSTMLLPNVETSCAATVRFTVQRSSGQKFSLPGGCVRWNYYWGENAPGWDFGVVLRYQDPLNFYRLVVSATRGEMGLWDATGGYLQLVPIPVKVGEPHELKVTVVGVHFTVLLDGKPALDYWDRTQPSEKGKLGLAVWQSAVRVDGFQLAPEMMLRVRIDPPPPHKPNFRFDTRYGTALFDGNEPISYFTKNPPQYGDSAGAVTQEAVKLKPGWRPTYYTALGPAVSGRWPSLIGELPAAFKVTGGGETISFSFQSETPGVSLIDYTCTVRYDAARGVYSYDYAGRQKFINEKPVQLNEYELFDPLTYNNRTPGPEVEHRWNPAGHRWNVYQGPDGGWLRYPIVDYLVEYNNPQTRWGRMGDFLYPDPAACPAFDTQMLWEQPKNRYFKLGQCTWGYDYHHTEVGAGTPIGAPTERPFKFTFTALLPAEAKTIYAQSKLPEAMAKDPTKLIPVDPRGTTFSKTTTWQDPSATMVWSGGTLDTATGHGDAASLRIDGPDSASIYLYQYMVEQYARRWRVSGWFKTKGSRGRGMQLRVKYAYAKEPQEIFYLGGVGDQDWKQFSFITTVISRRDCTSISFEQDGPGQVWLDGIAIAAVKEGENPQVTTFPVPAGLESSTDVLIDLRMDEPVTKAVYDESRNGHALYLNGPEWKQEDGRGFLHFDGVDDSGTLPLKPILEPRDPPPGTTGYESYKPVFRLDSFSYEYWARPRKPAKDSGMMVVFHYRLNPIFGFDQLFARPGECRLFVQNHLFREQTKIRLEKTVPYDQWAYVVATFADGKAVLYVNGEKSGEATYDPKGPGFHFFAYTWRYDFSSWVGTPIRRYRGDLGPLRLYTKALTPAEVAERYKNGWPKQ
ncbi:MAG: LamG-like jellyroll fold domain-containing protein [Armatimonadota bacterium]